MVLCLTLIPSVTCWTVQWSKYKKKLLSGDDYVTKALEIADIDGNEKNGIQHVNKNALKEFRDVVRHAVHNINRQLDTLGFEYHVLLVAILFVLGCLSILEEERIRSSGGHSCFVKLKLTLIQLVKFICVFILIWEAMNFYGEKLSNQLKELTVTVGLLILAWKVLLPFCSAFPKSSFLLLLALSLWFYTPVTVMEKTELLQIIWTSFVFSTIWLLKLNI